MAIDHGGTITRGFLFADLRGYTAFVEQRGAAAAAELLTRYRALAREAIGRFGGAEIKTEGDSFYVVFDSVSSAVRCGLAIVADARGKVEGDPRRYRHSRRRDGGGRRRLRRVARQHRRADLRTGRPGRGTGQRDRSGSHDDRPSGPVQVARSASAEGHRRADRALRSSGSSRRSDRVAVERSPTAVASGSCRAGWGLALLLVAAAGIGWWRHSRPPGFRLDSVDDRRAHPAEWRRFTRRYCCPQRRAARHRPGE